MTAFGLIWTWQAAMAWTWLAGIWIAMFAAGAVHTYQRARNPRAPTVLHDPRIKFEQWGPLFDVLALAIGWPVTIVVFFGIRLYRIMVWPFAIAGRAAGAKARAAEDTARIANMSVEQLVAELERRRAEGGAR